MSAYRGGRPSSGAWRQGNRPRQPRKLPEGYLDGGYFAKDAILKDRLIIDDAIQAVRALAYNGSLQDKPMEYSQFRKFFSFARQLEYRLRSGEAWDSVRQDVLRLRVHAADAVSRQVAPRVFAELMEKNTQWAASSAEAFLKGFLIHLESIVAFWPKKTQR